MGDKTEVTLVTADKEELDENLTTAEEQAVDDYYDEIDRQGNIDDLDANTKETLEKIWIVKKKGGVLTPVHKAFLGGGTVHKRDDYSPWD